MLIDHVHRCQRSMTIQIFHFYRCFLYFDLTSAHQWKTVCSSFSWCSMSHVNSSIYSCWTWSSLNLPLWKPSMLSTVPSTVSSSSQRIYLKKQGGSLEKIPQQEYCGISVGFGGYQVEKKKNFQCCFYCRFLHLHGMFSPMLDEEDDDKQKNIK